MIEQHLPILVVVGPMMAAPFCVLFGSRRLAQLIALVVCWLSFAGTIWLLASLIQSDASQITYELGGWKAPYGIEYVVDYLSGFVMMFVSGLAAIVLTYSPSSLNAEIPKSKHYLFYATYLLCMTGLLGICITCLLYTSPSPRDRTRSRMPSSA